MLFILWPASNAAGRAPEQPIVGTLKYFSYTNTNTNNRPVPLSAVEGKNEHNEGGNLNEFTAESQAQNPRQELGADVEPISHINLRAHGGFFTTFATAAVGKTWDLAKGPTWWHTFPGIYFAFYFLFFCLASVSHVLGWRSRSYPDSSTSQAPWMGSTQ